MQADVSKCGAEVTRVAPTDDILAARQRQTIGFMPMVEHLALGHSGTRRGAPRTDDRVPGSVS
jgi:hypothetical protein